MKKFMAIIGGMLLMSSGVGYAMSAMIRQELSQKYENAIARAFYKNINLSTFKKDFYQYLFDRELIDEIYSEARAIKSAVERNNNSYMGIGAVPLFMEIAEKLEPYSSAAVLTIKDTKRDVDNNNRTSIEAKIRHFSQLEDKIGNDLLALRKDQYSYSAGNHETQRLLLDALNSIGKLMQIARQSAELKLAALKSRGF